MTTEDSNRVRARLAINAARRGHLPKAKCSLTSNLSSTSLDTDNIFVNAKENSIEVYDDKFSRNSILTRSARIRKFKFYQYKPIQDTNALSSSPKPSNLALERDNSDQDGPLDLVDAPNNNNTSALSRLEYSSDSIRSSDPSILLPRDEILQGKVSLVAEESKELLELDEQIVELEKKIADLNKNGNTSVDKLDEMFDLVNQKNDLLRRQMQLNILEQEKNLEKANDELTKELRLLMSIDDSKKSKNELERQKYLYEQLLALVDKRNELVWHLDVQEKGIEDDNALRANLKTVISDTSTRNKLHGQEQNCCIQ